MGYNRCGCQSSWCLGTVKSVVVSRSNALVGFIYEAMKTFQTWQFLNSDMANPWLLKSQLYFLLLTTFLHTIYEYSIIGWMWDKNINKPEIKLSVFPCFNFHNLQIILLLSMTLICENVWFGCPNCVHPLSIKQYQNCFRVVPGKYKFPSLIFFCCTCL